MGIHGCPAREEIVITSRVRCNKLRLSTSKSVILLPQVCPDTAVVEKMKLPNKRKGVSIAVSIVLRSFGVTQSTSRIAR